MSILNNRYNFPVAILCWLSIILLVEGSVIRSVKSDNVSCDFQLDMCSWRQDTHDLSDWARYTNDGGSSYIVSHVSDNSYETVARIYSGLFSASHSPTVSLKHLMTSLSQSQPPKIHISIVVNGMVQFVTRIGYDGTLGWSTTRFQIYSRPGSEDSHLIIEAFISGAYDTVAVDDIVLTD